MKMVLDEPLQLAEGEVSLTWILTPFWSQKRCCTWMPTPSAAYYNHRITVGLDNRPGVRDDYMIYLEVAPQHLRSDPRGNTSPTTMCQNLVFPERRYDWRPTAFGVESTCRRASITNGVTITIPLED